MTSIVDHFPRSPRVPFAPVTDGTGEFVRANPWDSKLGGTPYRPKGTAWPTRPGTDEALGFTAQLNLGDVAEWCRREGHQFPLGGLLPDHGILQFFLPLEEGWGFRGTDCAVVWHPEVLKATWLLDEPLLAVAGDHHEPRFVFENPGRFPVRHEKKSEKMDRPYLKGSHRGGEATPLLQPDWPFLLRPLMQQPMMQMINPYTDQSLPESVSWEVYEENFDVISEHYGRGGSQLGGYPYFTQDDPREQGTDLVLLFQLDSGDIVWIGDSGVLNFFITPKQLGARDFSRVWMTWDCH